MSRAEMRFAVGALLLVAIGVVTPAFGRAHDPAPGLVHVPVRYLAQCRVTARKLGYAVPCPTRLPVTLTAHQDGATPDCNTTVMCPLVSGSWRGWGVGSLSSPGLHLVLASSPTALSSYAHAVDGPAWSPPERVRSLAWVTSGKWRMRAVYVSPNTNESAFVNHIALVWTVGSHTYAVGFHDYTGTRATLDLDRRVARWLTLVTP